MGFDRLETMRKHSESLANLLMDMDDLAFSDTLRHEKIIKEFEANVDEGSFVYFINERGVRSIDVFLMKL